ncbi:cytochrome P450 [Saccharomonospora cyanea]|uniref:Cytochrome P450 n=1 Tax=Saccharomonospora cyanea NA-134 TaxID=882082 RepID=H5XJW4_9PSEU|nr:cytochrome P450 [Saccharomonospora cyanea]EHR61879.1 cytochrome P450 [Saccharomonospora cyanea NA-134]
MADSESVLDYPMPNPTALEPPAEWARLRQECPVAKVRLPSGDEAALLTRYDDVKKVLADPRFTRQLDTRAGAARIAANESGGVFNSSMASTIPQSGPGHRRWRTRVGRWFTAKRMAALRPRIEAMADQLVDEMLERGQPADLKASLGFPLPVWVICDLLGVSDSDRDRFSYWSDTLLNLTKYGQAEIDAAQTEFVKYMSAHVAARRAEPGEDLLSSLITEDVEDPMSDAELVATGRGLLVAGHETTANMISKMVGMLLADRRRWEQLVANPALVRTAVEESLRFDANPGIGLPRFISEDVEISGTVVPTGSTVMCNMGAANRDENAFTDADEMDLSRSPNPHLTFGSGAHSCLGQALARTELQTTLEVLLRRLPTLELAVESSDLERVEGLAVGGLATLPVRW